MPQRRVQYALCEQLHNLQYAQIRWCAASRKIHNSGQCAAHQVYSSSELLSELYILYPIMQWVPAAEAGHSSHFAGF